MNTVHSYNPRTSAASTSAAPQLHLAGGARAAAKHIIPSRDYDLPGGARSCGKISLAALSPGRVGRLAVRVRRHPGRWADARPGLPS